MTAAPDPATTYGAHANPDLLSRIPLDARVVLDIGCGAGALGAAFRRRNPAARLIGIEPDAALRNHARGHLDAVHATDIESTPPPVAPGSLDAMVFGDVLEHLRDPWAVLRRDLHLLSDSGVLLVCVPNIEHWSFVARLMAGQWRYEPMGLFDRTHLRWFSRATMRAALEQAGYVPLEVAPRIFAQDKAEAFARLAEPGLRQLGIDPQEWRQRAFPLQYVWRAARVRPVPLVLVGRTDPNDAAGARRRILDPFAALATRPGIGTIAGPRAGVPASIGQTARIAVLQAGAAVDDSLRQAGAVIVRDLGANWPETAFDGVDAVQAATEAGAQAARAAGKPAVVFADAALEGAGPLLSAQIGERLVWYRHLWVSRPPR